MRLSNIHRMLLQAFYIFLGITLLLFAFYGTSPKSLPSQILNFYHKGLSTWSFFTPANSYVTIDVNGREIGEPKFERNFFLFSTLTNWRMTLLPLQILRGKTEDASKLCRYFEIPKDQEVILHLAMKKKNYVKEETTSLTCRSSDEK